MQDEEIKSALRLFCEFNGIEVPETIDDDVIAIDVNGVTEIWLSYLDAGELEVYAEIEGIDTDDPGIQRLLLESNFMGMATGSARFAISPVNDKAVLSERWNYERLLAENAPEGLGRFAAMVESWRTEGVALLQSKARGDEEQPGVPENAEIFRL
ncbi:CesT family type III secretion system chaperone [Tabrizicola sp. TH137]|uniref:CesT family type III secretion system chaperone n=1 Tax=Tabrizicola sp. TH137 TaxID=2067452 RepID=UPI00117D60D1|nr:CesT family type III secretion system chaperone [Tabrizicola sp. TH137]